MAVDVQEADAASTLHLTRRMLALRRAHPALRLGRFDALHADASVLLLRRQHEGDGVLAGFNFGDEAATVELAEPVELREAALTLTGARLQGRQLHLPPAAAWLMVLSTEERTRTTPDQRR